MSDGDTAPPGTLLVLYVLGESPDTPLTQAELQAEVRRATGYELDWSTLSRVVDRLADVGRIHAQREVSPDGETVRYDLNYSTHTGIDRDNSR